MIGAMEVRRRVATWRAVAATDVPAGQAKPKVHPARAGFQAFLTTQRLCWNGFQAGRVLADHFKPPKKAWTGHEGNARARSGQQQSL